MTQTRRLRRLPIVLLAVAGLGAGACAGPGSDSTGVASVKTVGDDKGAAGRGEAAAKARKDPEEALLDYARCMREHGVDMPDPDTSGGGGMVTFGAAAVGGGGTAPDMSEFEDADKACRDLLGDVGPMTMDPEQQQEMQDQALAFSRCMREHGVDMPDPTFSGEGAVTMTMGTGFDPGDPEFADAQQACGSAFGPKGARGGPGVSVSGGTAGRPLDGKGGGGFVISSGAVATSGEGGK